MYPANLDNSRILVIALNRKLKQMLSTSCEIVRCSKVKQEEILDKQYPLNETQILVLKINQIVNIGTESRQEFKKAEATAAKALEVEIEATEVMGIIKKIAKSEKRAISATTLSEAAEKAVKVAEAAKAVELEIVAKAKRATNSCRKRKRKSSKSSRSRKSSNKNNRSSKSSSNSTSSRNSCSKNNRRSSKISSK